MTVHLIRPAAGAKDLRSVAIAQNKRIITHNKRKVVPVYTRNKPRRIEELLDGGSLYWIIKSMVRARQRIHAVEYIEDEEHGKYCLIMLDPEIMQTLHVARKPFQGWRYLEDTAVPPDRTAFDPDMPDDDQELSPEMEADLQASGLL